MSDDLQESKMHLLEYSHRHGTDILVFDSEEAAWRGAAKVMLDSLGELDDGEQEEEILELMEKGEHIQALNKYVERTQEGYCDESFEVSRVIVLTNSAEELSEFVDAYRKTHDEMKGEPEVP